MMTIDVSRVFFYVSARRPVYVELPNEAKEEGEGDGEGAVPEGGTLRPWTESMVHHFK